MKNSNPSSPSYGNKYQASQAEKYKNRDKNHWKHRIDLAFSLVKKFEEHRFQEKERKDIVVADIGCSIGTFAIEFAKSGYHSYGIDFDLSALEIARQLSKEEHTAVEFIHDDVANWHGLSLPKIDIAICFDIFEHLHDDQLGALLVTLKNQLSEKGMLIFHTFPTEYDYLFYSTPWYIRLPLYLTKRLSEGKFNCFVKIYGLCCDILRLVKNGRTHKESIQNNKHCNPLSLKRLEDIFVRSGYQIQTIQTAQLYPFKGKIQKTFLHQPISHRNLFGVATIR